MLMNRTVKSWEWEVESVMEQLVNGGIPPFDAAEKARDIVSARRRKAAQEQADKLPEDVRRALFG